jgi:signal transduction histidine kinase
MRRNDCPDWGPRAAWRRRHGPWGHHWKWQGGKPPRPHFFFRILFLFLIVCVTLVLTFASEGGLTFHGFLMHLGWTFLILIGVGLILGKMFKPMRHLMMGVQEIADGNLDFQFPLRGHGEFDYLAQHFNHMVENIREMVKSRDQLLLDVSHELRSPLTRMKVALEMAPEGAWKQSVQQDITEMETMLAEILESERLKNGNGKLVLAPMNLKALAMEFSQKYKNQKPGVKVSSPLPSLTLEADESRIRTVLQNVLENALKYSANQKKAVELELAGGDKQVSLTIRDFGEGIPTEEQERVFEPFYRVDKSRAKTTGGYGLGLHLCREIMRAHGGDVILESTPGEGTLVSLIFQKATTTSPL